MSTEAPDAAPVRVAVVGAAGWAGSRHVSGFARAGARLVGLVDPGPGTADLARRWSTGVLRSVDDVDPAAVDLAVVALPTRAQPGVCAHLLERGLRVLSEKPVAVDPAGAAVLATVPDVERRLQVAYLLHQHPAVGLLREWTRSADVVSVSVRTVARKRTVDSWRADPGEGRVLVVNAVHAIELVASLFPGEVDVVDRWDSSRLYGSGVPELVHATYQVRGGPRVRIETYWSPWDNDEGLNDGDFDLTVDLVAPQGRRLWRNWRLRSWDRDGEERVRRFTPFDLFQAQAIDALSFARGGPPRVGFRQSLRATEIAAALLETKERAS